MIIKNGKVLRFINEDVILEHKDILIQKGIIVKIEENICDEDEEVIDAKGNIVMPGLINAHSHIPMSIFRGTFEGCNLYTWLNEKIWPIEDKLSMEDFHSAAEFSILEMISTGTTCVNDMYTIPSKTIKLIEEIGFRIMLTKPFIDVANDLDVRVEEFEKLYAARNKENDLIMYSVSPHGLYTCSDRCLEISRQIAIKYNLPVHVHYLESQNEIEDIKQKHGACAIDVLKRYFSSCKIILAHGVKIDDENINELKNMNCGIAHNPVSNLMLACKIADTTKWIKEGLCVGLGTDGQGSGNTLDMFESMKFAALSQGGIHENEKTVSLKDVIKMATINGAKLLGIEDKVGSIDIGKQGDIIIVDTSEKLDSICRLPNNNELFNLVYNTVGRDVLTTLVKGKILMQDRKLLVGNFEESLKNVKEIINTKI